jgi:hypothetical protein
MRERLIGAALAAWFVLSAAVLAAGPLWAQQAPPDSRLDPNDQLAPSQLAQPVPAAVPEPSPAPAPSAAPGSKPPAKHAQAAPTPTPKPAPAPGSAPAKPPHAAAARTVVECSGPFAKDSGMLALAVAFDARNMTFTQEDVQGVKVGATIIFPNDPRRRLEVWWSNPNRTGTYLIDIAGKSIWTGPEGLKLGLTLAQLEKLNHKPFKLKGFDKDNIATVSDWDGGALATLAGGCKAGVSVHANIKTDASAELPAADQYSSDDPAMRALKPTVSEILIGY